MKARNTANMVLGICLEILYALGIILAGLLISGVFSFR
jgi:hypothetical protein